jgi:soluble lytic murein transglycosylase
MFYYRQLNWQEAARCYRRLWDLFPQDNRLRDDGWRLGWCDYLLGDANTAEVMHKYLMQFPDSARTPAALYWLGQVEEDQGAIAEARALYALVVHRFAHTYYAPHAAAHLATLRARQGSVAATNDSAAAPLAAALIPVLTPPVVPPGLACAHVTPLDAAGLALILQALDLPNLEQDVLKAAVARENPPVELRLLLAGTYSTQGNVSSALFGALKTAPGYSRMEFSDLPGEVWDLLYPPAYSKLIAAQAHLNNLEPYLVMGLIRQESAFDPHALSNANARGLMQVLPQTAASTTRSSRVRTAGKRLYDPNYNIRVGCAYLAQLLKEFNGQPEFAVAAYNAGDSRVKEWMKKYTFRDRAVFLESIPIPATRNYVELVLRDAEVYRQLLSGTSHFAQCSQGQAAGEARGLDITPFANMPVTPTAEGALAE